MAQRILVIDSDKEFGEILRDQFAGLGAMVELQTDGDKGLAHSKQLQPDLILLAIELNHVNGFLVCKKIKNDPQLKSIPLLIMSSESTDEIFEQHKGLRTRAEDYLHKPIQFDDLIEKLKPFIVFDGDPSGGDDLAIDDEDEIFIEESVRSIPPSKSQVDSDISDFADSAFDAIMLENVSGGPAESDEQPEQATVVAPVEYSEQALSSESEFVLGADSESVEGASAEAKTSTSEEEMAEHPLEAVNKGEEELSVSEAAKRSASIPVSSKEYLELRGEINRKDKELLELKDQIHRHEKQLMAAKDKNLELERELNERGGKALEFETHIAELRANVEALSADKENLTQRVQQHKKRVAELEEQSEKVESELKASRTLHENALGELRNEHATAIAQEQALKQQSLDELKQQHQSALDKLSADHETALVVLRQELEESHAQAVQQVREKHSDEIAILGRELSERDKTLVEVEEQLSKLGEQNQSLAEQSAASDAKVFELDAERTSLLTKNSQAQAEIDTLEHEKADRMVRIATLDDKLRTQQSILDAAQEKISRDEQRIEKIHKALAIALSLSQQQVEDVFRGESKE